MYLLKRILANIIDGAFFLLMMFVAGWLCLWRNVVDNRFEVDFPFFFALLTVLVLPICLFSNTIGERALRLLPVQNKARSFKIGLLMKYLVIYSLVSFSAINTINFFRDVLKTYTIFSISEFFIVRTVAAILITNITFFLASWGRTSLIDRIFGISYGPPMPARWYQSVVFAVVIFVLSMVEGMVVDWKFHNFFSTKQIMNFANSATQIRLPEEAFDQYVVNSQLFCRFELTDLGVTTSDVNSFIQDKYFFQRQIVAQINDSLLINPVKRREFCSKLLDYCYGLVAISDTTRLIEQTKFDLVYLKHISPFIGISQHFIYYFDDTTSKYGLYGGFDWDKLTLYYIQTKKNIRDSLVSLVSMATAISKDSANWYLETNDTSQFPRMFVPAIDRIWSSIDIRPLIDHRILAIQPIPFDSVKPIKDCFVFTDYAKFAVFSGPFYDTQEIGTIGMRNSILVSK